MKKLTLSFDQCRRELRRELFIQRQLDSDNSENRLFIDALKLDAQLIAKGYQLPYATEWGKSRAKNTQQVGVTDLICAGG
jgi:hypothetical protein